MLLLCANHAYIFFSDPRSKEEKQSKKAKVETNGVLQAKLLNRKMMTDKKLAVNKLKKDWAEIL